MGFFTNVQKNTAETEYNRAKKFLKPKDGKIHVIMFNSFSKFGNQVFECENKYTTQIDEIISSMQDDGYEIVDIKLTILQNQGTMNISEGYNTLIMYR